MKQTAKDKEEQEIFRIGADMLLEEVWLELLFWNDEKSDSDPEYQKRAKMMIKMLELRKVADSVIFIGDAQGK